MSPAPQGAATDPAGAACRGVTGRVVVLGSLNTDIFARVAHHPKPGETVIGRGGESRPGGKGANQAVAAALAGASVLMIGAVGNDAHARTALAGLERSGADTSSVRAVDRPTGIALITVADDGENSIIVIPGANEQTGDPELAALADLTAADVLVLQGEVSPTVAAAAAHTADRLGARVVINLAPVVAYPVGALRLADPLVVNEHEGVGALRILRPDVPVSGSAPAEVVEALVAAGARSVVMTLGGQGALVADGAQTVTSVPAHRVAVVDTTGAGDAFVGALVARLVHGDSLVDSATHAAAFAAEAVQHEGAQDSYPDWREATP